MPRSDDVQVDPNTDSQMRLLVLMRHAEAGSRSADGDIGRELTSKGRQVARAVGAWLLGQGVRPDVVVVSPSVRTRQTWAELNAAGLPADDVFSDEALYGADPEHIVESVQAVPEDTGTLLVVGHAPGVPRLVHVLESHLPQGADDRQQGWPPGAVAVVGHRGPWSQFPAQDTAVVAFHRP